MNMSKNEVDPNVIIIYVTDNQAHMVGAMKRNGQWCYSGPAILPEKDLNEFIAEVSSVKVLQSVISVSLLRLKWREWGKRLPCFCIGGYL
jgi:hypothetical protein